MDIRKPVRLNILLADDDVDDRLFFEKALKELPIAADLIIVNDGEELMKHLSGHYHDLPDAIFLDLSMPRKTGFECLTEIKEEKRLQDIPVVVFTTSFGRSTSFEINMIETLTNIGAFEYVRKPSDIEQLKKIIQSALTRIIEKRPDESPAP